MRNIKKVLCFALAATMVMSFVACGSNTGKKADNKKTVENTDKNLVVGFDQNFPPFGYVGKDGEYTGFDIELAAEAAKRLKMDVVYQPIDWDAKDMELSSGTIDCIWNGFTINGREDQYAWSDAYMNNAQVFVVRSDSGITSEKDLKGKIVDVQKESSAESALNSEESKSLTGSFSQLISVADYNTAMMDLESGAVDAVAMDKFVALDQTKDKGDTFQVLSYEISSEQYGIGFEKKNTTLRDKVNAALKEMNADGTFAKISKKYFGEDVSILQ
jgi:polar amino acid transport system substrate-binding protein